MLPAKQELDEATFDALFQTPHGGTFDFLGHYPGVHHEHVNVLEPDALDAALVAAKNRPQARVTILEVGTSTPVRLALDGRIRSAVKDL